jgi:hypothetical protein
MGMLNTVIGDLAEVAQEGDEPPVFEGNAHDLLKATYQGRYRPTPAQLRAAMVALPFESPKLTAMAVSSMDGEHFAAMLEKAIARSHAPLKQIELKANDGPVLEPRPRAIHGRSGEGQR